MLSSWPVGFGIRWLPVFILPLFMGITITNWFTCRFFTQHAYRMTIFNCFSCSTTLPVLSPPEAVGSLNPVVTPHCKGEPELYYPHRLFFLHPLSSGEFASLFGGWAVSSADVGELNHRRTVHPVSLPIPGTMVLSVSLLCLYVFTVSRPVSILPVIFLPVLSRRIQILLLPMQPTVWGQFCV